MGKYRVIMEAGIPILKANRWGVFLVVLFEFSEKSVDLDLFRPL
jgi:hypothetical protein